MKEINIAKTSMTVNTAISILQDIQQSLVGDNAKQKALSIINQYIRNLEITQNEKIKKLITKQQEYHQKYGEFDKRTLKMNKKIDEELKKIFSS